MTVSILNQQKHFAAFADGSLLIKETSSLTFVHHQRTKVAPGAPPPPIGIKNSKTNLLLCGADSYNSYNAETLAKKLASVR